MTLALIILGIIAWYQIGLLGSTLGIRNINHRCGLHRPVMGAFGLFMAIGGPLNLLAAWLVTRD